MNFRNYLKIFKGTKRDLFRNFSYEARYSGSRKYSNAYTYKFQLIKSGVLN